MRLARIELSNWMCYEGVQSVELKESSYAVVASYVHDAARSNWGGKSSFVDAIRFAVYGDHRHRTEDDWITHGAAKGGVILEFSDGAVIERARTRGKRTDLTFSLNGRVAKQGDAQAEIDRWLGVDSEMFRVTSYFEQRQMARLILAKPEERMAMVSSWLNLEPLKECERLAKEAALRKKTKIDEFTAKVNGYNVAIAAAEEVIAKFEEEGGDVGLREEIEGATSELENLIKVREEAVKKNALYASASTALQRRNALRSELNALPAVDVGAVKDGEADFAAIREQMQTCGKEMDLLRPIARGQFDGACPALKGFQCPAQLQINDRAAVASEQLASISKKYSGLSSESDELSREIHNARAILEKRETLKSRLKDAVATLGDSYETILSGGEASTDELDKQHSALVDRLSELRVELSQIEKLRATLKTNIEERDRCATSIAQEEIHYKSYFQAGSVFGRNGAQRKVAEQAVSEIECCANELLNNAGIDLNVQVQWAREGKGLATACEECGFGFASSAKVKECVRCGAPRGQAIVNKMEIVLSDRSGAAEDLAGIAIQLAASQWLRRERGGQVDFAILDEPFGALDKSNRKALSAALPKMLAAAGIHQAFVIAHSSDVLDALPSRIQIVSHEGRATVSQGE